MREKKIITIVLMCVFVWASIGVTPGTATSYTGSSDVTTSIFSIAKYAKIDWNFTRESDYSYFNTYFYEQRSTKFSDYLFDFGDNETGSTYYYQSGKYFFNITASNIASWTINVTESNGDYLLDHDSITGVYSTNSKLFKAYGTTNIHWTTISANDLDAFFVYIYEPGTLNYAGSFHGENGTTTFSKTGDYYFNILCANLVSYTITLDITNPNKINTTTTNNPTSTTTTTQDEGSITSNTTKTTDFKGYLVAILFLPAIMVKIRKKKL